MAASRHSASNATRYCLEYLEKIHDKHPDYLPSLIAQPLAHAHGRLFFDLTINKVAIPFEHDEALKDISLSWLSDSPMVISNELIFDIQNHARQMFTLIANAFIPQFENTTTDTKKLARKLAGAFCYKVWCLKNKTPINSPRGAISAATGPDANVESTSPTRPSILDASFFSAPARTPISRLASREQTANSKLLVDILNSPNDPITTYHELVQSYRAKVLLVFNQIKTKFAEYLPHSMADSQSAETHLKLQKSIELFVTMHRNLDPSIQYKGVEEPSEDTPQNMEYKCLEPAVQKSIQEDIQRIKKEMELSITSNFNLASDRKSELILALEIHIVFSPDTAHRLGARGSLIGGMRVHGKNARNISPPLTPNRQQVAADAEHIPTSKTRIAGLGMDVLPTSSPQAAAAIPTSLTATSSSESSSESDNALVISSSSGDKPLSKGSSIATSTPCTPEQRQMTKQLSYPATPPRVLRQGSGYALSQGKLTPKSAGQGTKPISQTADTTASAGQNTANQSPAAAAQSIKRPGL